MSRERAPYRRAGGVLTCVGVALVVGGGCTPADPAGPDRTTATIVDKGAGKVVTTGPGRDLDPVMRRFPLLADGTVDGWIAGTIGAAPGLSERVPGPTTYWFDAVVDVGTEQVAAWVREYDAASVAAPDSVAVELRDLVQSGEFVGGRRLDDAFSSARWHARVYLSPTTGRVVVLGIGD